MLCAIHLNNATSNLLEVMPILLFKHLVALPGDADKIPVWWPVEKPINHN